MSNNNHLHTTLGEMTMILTRATIKLPDVLTVAQSDLIHGLLRSFQSGFPEEHQNRYQKLLTSSTPPVWPMRTNVEQWIKVQWRQFTKSLITPSVIDPSVPLQPTVSPPLVPLPPHPPSVAMRRDLVPTLLNTVKPMELTPPPKQEDPKDNEGNEVGAVETFQEKRARMLHSMKTGGSLRTFRPSYLQDVASSVVPIDPPPLTGTTFSVKKVKQQYVPEQDSWTALGTPAGNRLGVNREHSESLRRLYMSTRIKYGYSR
jgi:hypothetical protein